MFKFEFARHATAKRGFRMKERGPKWTDKVEGFSIGKHLRSSYLLEFHCERNQQFKLSDSDFETIASEIPMRLPGPARIKLAAKLLQSVVSDADEQAA